MGPRKKDWDEVFPWIVKTVEEVVDVPLCIDTTNVNGMEAALKTVTKAQPILNSTSADPDRFERYPEQLYRIGLDAHLYASDRSSGGIRTGCRDRWRLAENGVTFPEAGTVSVLPERFNVSR